MFRKSSRAAAAREPRPDLGDTARWMHIAQGLLPMTGNERFRISEVRKADPQDSVQAFVQILERPTSRTASILWRNAGRCYYGEQLWVRGVANCSGRCAVSGRSVKRGDYIYRPRRGKLRPVNAFSVILAAVIETEGCTGS